MAVEIERKWAPGEVPRDLPPGTPIRQGYLAEEGGTTVRVRITDAGSWLTIKAGGAGLSRTEVELPISPGDAEDLWAHTTGLRVGKVRHRVPVDGWTAEVDVFAGALDGLCVVEVEFDSAESAAGFEAPEWFGTEVTGRPEWSNASLARHGRPSR